MAECSNGRMLQISFQKPMFFIHPKEAWLYLNKILERAYSNYFLPKGAKPLNTNAGGLIARSTNIGKRIQMMDEAFPILKKAELWNYT